MDQATRDRMHAEIQKHGELKATPKKNAGAAALGENLGKLHEFVSRPFGYNNPPAEMISEALGLPATARTLERIGHGEPLTTGTRMTLKPRSDTIDAAMAMTGLAPALKGLPAGASIKPVGKDVGKFIEDVYSKYPVNPINPRQRAMVWGEGDAQQLGMFELKPSNSVRGGVELDWISGYPQREGVGTKTLKTIQAHAQEAGIPITLWPWDKGTVSQKALTKFYKQNGFEPTTKGGKALVWNPKPDSILPLAERDANLAKFVEPSKEPGRWYHGTAEDVKEFDPSRGLEKPGQAAATFVSQTTTLPEKFAKDSADYMKQFPDKYLTPEQKLLAIEDTKNYFKSTYGDDMAEHAEAMIKSLESGNPQGEAIDELHNAYKTYLPSGPNIMPVHVQVENPFDPAIAEHVEKLRALNPDLPLHEIGRTSVMETPEVQRAIQDAAFDSFYTSEGGQRNLGIFDPRRIKSAIGNRGTYDIKEADLTKKDGGSVHSFFPSTDEMQLKLLKR